MNSNSSLSLKEWARKHKIYNLENWIPFLKDYLIPFFKDVFKLKKFYDFLKGEEICQKESLRDIENDSLKEKIRVAIYGGVDQDKKDFKNSFAKFMFDIFGICAEDSQKFEDSIEYYENFGDNIKLTIRNSWIDDIQINELYWILIALIRNISNKLDVKLSDFSIIEKNYSYEPNDIINPEDLLIKPNEKPDDLMSLYNNFRQKAFNLSIGVNPFTTFIYFCRSIPLIILIDFLKCDVNDMIELIDFLGYESYSMINLDKMELSVNSIDKIFLYKNNRDFIENVLELQTYLNKIVPFIEDILKKMIQESIDSINISFEPWDVYKQIFTFWKKILKDKNWCDFEIENGYLSKIYISNEEKIFESRILFKDFLLKISPFIAIG
ncbi:MAG: hypothetical protein ACTSVV_07030, partial [Promethearchaeota archaeon]